MQPLTESDLRSDPDVRTRIYIQEQLRQAAMLRQIDRTAAGIKSGVTICALTLGLFLAGKVLPYVSKSISGKSQSALLSTIATTDSYKTQPLVVIGHDNPRIDTSSDQHVSDSLRVDTRP